MKEWTNWIQLFFSPKGRIKRYPFFIGNIALYLFLLVTLTTFNLSSKDIFLKGNVWTAVGVVNPMGLMVTVLYTYSFFILMIKRLRDINRSLWLCLLASIPGVNIAFLLFLIFKESYTKKTYPSGRNHYIDAA